MIIGKHNESLFVEKYRPQTVEECILPKSIKKPFLDMVKQGKIPNMILSGGSGLGKCLGYDTLIDIEISQKDLTNMKKKGINFTLTDP
jgi:replication-associated recombination protein RarA